MTEAGWTREKPTEPGWYWWENVALAQHHKKQICRIFSRAGHLYVNFNDGTKYTVESIDGEWLGPITPDSYQQGRVAGIKAVRRKITDLIDRGFTDYEEDMDDLIEWTDFQLAQQAQEGANNERT